MLLLAGLALLGFPLVLLPFMVLLSFSRPSGLGFLDSYKIKLFELFADGRVLDANKLDSRSGQRRAIGKRARVQPEVTQRCN